MPTTPTKKQNPIEPQLSELKSLIDSQQITAISIDTTTFDQSGKLYVRGVFGQLRQFKVHPQKLIISDVVINEINAHYRERVAKYHSRLGDLSKACEFLGGSTDSIATIITELSKLQSIEEICSIRLRNFLSDSNATVVHADDYIRVSDITSMYFQNLPPFHTENKKKDEFPDAIALVTLERWAEQNNTHVVVVSNDGDWQAFCGKSERLHLVKSLPDALSIFQHPTKIVEEMLARLNSELRDPESTIFSLMYESIEEHNWEENITAIVHSNCESDQEVDCQLFNAVLMDSGGDAVKITNNDGKTVSFAFKYEVTALAIVYCDFRRWNDADSEYEYIGHSSSSNEFFKIISVLLTMPVSQGEFFDMTVEIQPFNVRVDFDVDGPD